VIRLWRPIEIEMEFRGFVANGKLNALSQYNHIVYFPELWQRREQIQQTILTFFNTKLAEILPKIYPRCVLDFALVGPQLEVIIIEINPFLPTTNDALFSWRDDMNVLLNGPFEFRLRKKVDASIRATLIPEWRALIAQSNSQAVLSTCSQAQVQSSQ